MKKYRSLGIGLTYAGCYLGAGYVSGQELWQYFGSYSIYGFLGLFAAMLLFYLLGSVLFFTVSKTKISEMDRVIVQTDNRLLLTVSSVLQIIFFICVVIIMVAGVASLVHSLFGIPKYISSLLFCGLIFLLALNGIQGLIRVFSATVPVLVIFAVLISILSVIYKPDASVIKEDVTSVNAFNVGWSAIVYMSFNFFGCIGIMAPVFAKVNDRKMAKRGILIGTVVLCVIAFCVIFALLTNPVFSFKELPMLDLSYSLGNIFGVIYAVLLFCAMMGTALSSLVAVDNYMVTKSGLFKRFRSVFLALITAVCFLFSLLGFSELIGTVYPIFGVLGFFAIGMLLYNFLKIKQKNH